MFQPPSPDAVKTVLELDLVAFSDVARALEEALSVEAVREFQDQIQEFVDRGLASVGLERDKAVLGTAGDNAILVFDEAAVMHRFAETVQQETLRHNDQRTVDLAKRWFRMGAATGLVKLLPGGRIVGTTVARAVRLEAAAERGQLVVDNSTFSALPTELQRRYGSEEPIRGKRDERFQGHRCTFIELPRDGAHGRARERSASAADIEQLKLIYDLYRTSYLNQKYYGFRLHQLGGAIPTQETVSQDRVKRMQDCERLFRGYVETTSVLRLVVENIRVTKGLSRKAAHEYRRVRETIVELEKLDEPSPDRGLIRRFEREVNREIPPRVLWLPDGRWHSGIG
jgi:class 3 adenylate cyclase